MATQKLILAKSVKCPKWSHAVSPIKKGTEVEVSIGIDALGAEVSFTVKHPAIIGVFINVDKSYFVDTRIKANVKVGDKFWFASIYSFEVWEDVIVKITPKFAYFKNHPVHKGIFKISLFDLNTLGVVCSEISIERDTRFDETQVHYGDKVNISKNKRDVQIEITTLIVKLKIDKEHAIENLAKEHTQKMEEYAKLESQEDELKKEINCNL